MNQQPLISVLRIISGKWRSRKITFTEAINVRPTHNRIRETVFNWLAQMIENSVCLDAFAGSGAMGFEALSRGAKHVTFCDITTSVIQQIEKNAHQLMATNFDAITCDFMQENRLENKKFDLVFLDPPFQKNILLNACDLLESRQLLQSHAQIYLECQKNSVDFTKLPLSWVIKKHKNTKTIDYLLCERR